MKRLLVALGLFLLPSACATVPHSYIGVNARRPHNGTLNRAKWAAPPLEQAVSVRNGRTGERISFEAFLDAIAKADVVFLGETHTDETTHRVEHAVYQGLLARNNGNVVLSMEMFERDVQPHLDAYLAGEIDEAIFLEKARPWKNYRTAYRPMIEEAKARGGSVVAANFPRPLRRRVAMEGPQVLDTLEGDAARQSPARIFPNTQGYWRRVENAVRSHRAMVSGQSEEDRLYSTQSLWDNAMGDACAVALEEHPGHMVLHINGGFHSAYWDGTVHQFRKRKPRAKVITVAISPVMNPNVAKIEGLPVADYVVFAEARATDLNDGTWSVYVAREQKYRFHLPEGATDDNPVPLLIWLGDDGLTAADGMDLWKDRLGSEVAIAVLDPAYPAIQEDLSQGGRWFWPDSFTSDVGTLVGAVERTWAYLLRHYPIDAGRVCVAGEGTGATVVTAVGLLANDMDMQAIALNPRRYAKVKDFSLPLPEFRGDKPPAEKSLRVIVSGGEDEWWSQELAEYVGVGLDASLVRGTDDPWLVETEAENMLRAALGVEARPTSDSKERRYLLMDVDSPRSRHWARLGSRVVAVELGVAVAVLSSPPTNSTAAPLRPVIHAETFTSPGALPKCPGPFGGTTVVVVPDGTTSGELQAWRALEENDPLKKKSRFLRLRVATSEEGNRLPDVLAKLHAEKRENVLIVPAAFCANAARMRSLKRSVRSLENQMTLHWLPGLGGQKMVVDSRR